MKTFHNSTNYANYDYTIDIIKIWELQYLRITQACTAINATTSKNFDIDIMALLNIKLPEVEMMYECYNNQIPNNLSCQSDNYGMTQANMGRYSIFVDPLCQFYFPNHVVELGYDDNKLGGFYLRKLDSKNSVYEYMELTRDSAYFIMGVIIQFYEKNKDKVK